MIRKLILILSLSLIWHPILNADSLRLYNLGELLLDYDVSKYPGVMQRINTVSSYIEDADVIIGNLETTVQPDGLNAEQLKSLYKNPSLTVTHHTPKSAIDILSNNLAVNLFSLANNHSYDLGSEGVLAGLKAMEEKKLTHAGTGHNYAEATGYRLLETKGKKIAFFAFTNVTLLKDNEPLAGSIPTHHSAGIHCIAGSSGAWDNHAKDHLLESIEALKAKNIVDYIFVSGHIHYTNKSTRPWGADGKYPTAISKEMINAGADAFFIEGPHAPKGFEVYNDKPIFYGVGNLIFNSRKRVGRYRDYRWYSYIADCVFKDNKIVAIKIIPLIANKIGLQGDHTKRNQRQLHWETRGYAIPVTGEQASTVLNHIDKENQKSTLHNFSTQMDIQGDFAYWPNKEAYQMALKFQPLNH
jgi:poly-gamma-glutamate capsule biosynthesis protein CapA/YwtB (metallophosphatase superfamily)